MLTVVKPGVTDIKWFAMDIKGNQSAVQTQRFQIGERGGHRRRLRAGDARADAGRSGHVRRVHAGCRAEYTASTTATVTRTAGDATLVG